MDNCIIPRLSRVFRRVLMANPPLNKDAAKLVFDQRSQLYDVIQDRKRTISQNNSTNAHLSNQNTEDEKKLNQLDQVLRILDPESV